MIKKSHLLRLSMPIMLLVFGLELFAQTPTIGVRFFDETVSDGFTLFSPENNNNVYLVNSCGEKINEWTFTEKPGATCYLLENGNLLRAGRQSIEIRAWDNTVIWTFLMSSIGLNQHHDIEPLPNGNILCLITDNYTDIEMIALGKDPTTVDLTFKLDKIIELEPVGVNGANLVWEWKFIDHFIQDFDNTKPDFGVVEDHPELINLNYVDANIANLSEDFTHVNAIDYNASLDQIIISSRNLNEIYIIDHSTNTAQAAGHSGGNFNQGGDFLWRWGNPRAYGQGDTSDQKLFLQHDSKWVEPGYLDEGKITVFNNGGDGTNTFSSVHIITPEIINDTYIKENNKFKPLDFEWSWNGSFLGETVLEGKKSGAHSLPNGNFIICENGIGQVSEISKTGTQLWTYKNPTGVDGFVFDQFDVISENSLFRAEKYPSDYVGFIGKDLSSQGILENTNSVSVNCIATLDMDSFDLNELRVYNPVDDGIIRFNKSVSLDRILIYDLQGKLVYENESFNGNQFKVNLRPSMYFMKLYSNETVTTIKILIKA